MKRIAIPLMLMIVTMTASWAFGEPAGDRTQPVPPPVNLPGDLPQGPPAPGRESSGRVKPPEEVLQNLEVLRDLPLLKEFDFFTQSGLASEEKGGGCSGKAQSKGGCSEKPE
jgi:hypothetical protein